MLQIDSILTEEQIQFASVTRASKAAQGIYMWVVGIRNYYCVQKDIKPKREAYI